MYIYCIVNQTKKMWWLDPRQKLSLNPNVNVLTYHTYNNVFYRNGSIASIRQLFRYIFKCIWIRDIVELNNVYLFYRTKVHFNVYTFYKGSTLCLRKAISMYMISKYTKYNIYIVTHSCNIGTYYENSKDIFVLHMNEYININVDIYFERKMHSNKYTEWVRIQVVQQIRINRFSFTILSSIFCLSK